MFTFTSCKSIAGIIIVKYQYHYLGISIGIDIKKIQTVYTPT